MYCFVSMYGFLVVSSNGQEDFYKRYNEQWSFMGIGNATFSVDTFFTLRWGLFVLVVCLVYFVCSNVFSVAQIYGFSDIRCIHISLYLF